MKYNSNINYCTFFPNHIGKVNYNYECYLHDEEYGNRVKERGTRKEVDRDLKERVYFEFDVHEKQILGFFVSNIIYLGVRFFGWIKWCKEVKNEK